MHQVTPPSTIQIVGMECVKHTTTGLWSSGNLFCGVTKHASLFGGLMGSLGLVDVRRTSKFGGGGDNGMGAVFQVLG